MQGRSPETSIAPGGIPRADSLSKMPINSVQREVLLQEFLQRSRQRGQRASIGSIYRAARVDKKNFRQWRRGELADRSVMSIRIEAVLGGGNPDGGRKKEFPHCIPPIGEPYVGAVACFDAGPDWSNAVKAKRPMLAINVDAEDPGSPTSAAARAHAVFRRAYRPSTSVQSLIWSCGGIESLRKSTAGILQMADIELFLPRKGVRNTDVSGHGPAAVENCSSGNRHAPRR